MQSKILWNPPAENFKTTHMAKFLQHIQNQYSPDINDYAALHQWSITQPEKFWREVSHFCNMKFSHEPKRIIEKSPKMQNTKWFPGATLNFAENLLKRRDHQTAIIFRSEAGHHSQLSYQELYANVAALAAHLKMQGVKSGDRVAAFMPNCPETVIAMLATTSLGAVWTSCSSDFGITALLDRFEQVEPKILFAIDSHVYSGKSFSHLAMIEELQKKLPSLKQTIVVPFSETKPNITLLTNTVLWNDAKSSAQSIDFVQTTFDHPLYILYSSGTTGKPKCMVHGVGRTLIQHLKELMLHSDLHSNDRIFFYTTCGWMMWNWLVSSLAVGATIVLYEGNPFYPNSNVLFNLIDETKINILGVGAKLIETAENRQLKPIQSHDLSSLRIILTTASPLLPESFDYIYQWIKPNVQVSSISGGSDIISCFALGNPLLPVYRGELQCIGLGMDVQIFSQQGQKITDEKGELVCTSAFPSMPIYFWNDPLGEKYQKAYFDKYPNVWAHGDYAMITQHNSVVIFGRSDATLNPGGIRIGTAEIYNQVQKFAEISDCLAVGQSWKGSERIILFIVLQNGVIWNNELARQVKNAIRENASPHHVPSKIIVVPDLPRTISGKIMELIIKKMIHKEEISNMETLANPECLKYFKNIMDLSD